MAFNEAKFAVVKKIEKNKKVNFRCPYWAAVKMLKEGMIKDQYGLKSYQELFEYLVVSGVVYLKPEILEFLKKELPKYRQKYVQSSLAKLGKAEAPVKEKYMQLQAWMYEQDFHAFNNFCIENNVKPSWIYHCLFIDGFIAEQPVIINLIKDCLDKQVRARKNTVARLVKDTYIDVLSSVDSAQILNHLTKKFDAKDFDVNLISDVVEIEKQLHAKEKEDIIDEELNKKFDGIKKMRDAEIEKALEPVALDKSET